MSKQLTAEDIRIAAENYTTDIDGFLATDAIRDFTAGAKWAAELGTHEWSEILYDPGTPDHQESQNYAFRHCKKCGKAEYTHTVYDQNGEWHDMPTYSPQYQWFQRLKQISK